MNIPTVGSKKALFTPHPSSSMVLSAKMGAEPVPRKLTVCLFLKQCILIRGAVLIIPLGGGLWSCMTASISSTRCLVACLHLPGIPWPIAQSLLPTPGLVFPLVSKPGIHVTVSALAHAWL